MLDRPRKPKPPPSIFEELLNKVRIRVPIGGVILGGIEAVIWEGWPNELGSGELPPEMRTKPGGQPPQPPKPPLPSMTQPLPDKPKKPTPVPLPRPVLELPRPPPPGALEREPYTPEVPRSVPTPTPVPLPQPEKQTRKQTRPQPSPQPWWLRLPIPRPILRARARPKPLPFVNPSASPLPVASPAPSPAPLPFAPPQLQPPLPGGGSFEQPQGLTRSEPRPLSLTEPPIERDDCKCETRRRPKRPSNKIASVTPFRRRMSQNSLDNLRRG